MIFTRYLAEVIRFLQLPAGQRRLIFYSEGKNYWPHLTGLIHELLNTTNIPVCYISSDLDDPGLQVVHSNLNSFVIGEGFIRSWLFERIETDVMVLTMPDLQNYQIKRSKHNVHYVYVQHSLVSLHMAYRKGAFDFYDTIFCAGPHHIAEIHAMEAEYDLPTKKLLEHGYSRLDGILKEGEKRREIKKQQANPLHVLIAPSWGVEGIIESGLCDRIIYQLLENYFRVTLRPHPQTIRFAKDRICVILKKYGDHSNFSYENNISSQESLHESDIMISDWSGAALDYSLGLHKPVVFVDVSRKVNNPDYQMLDITPMEVSIRESIGVVVAVDSDFERSIFIDLVNSSYLGNPDQNIVFNVGNSDQVGCSYLRGLLCV